MRTVIRDSFLKKLKVQLIIHTNRVVFHCLLLGTIINLNYIEQYENNKLVVCVVLLSSLSCIIFF